MASHPQDPSGAAAAAAAAAATAGAIAAHKAVLPYGCEVDDLDNGLRLVTVRTDFPNLVSVQIVVATGSRNEIEEGKSGFAHFFEHMMFRGTKSYTSAQQTAMFKRMGAERNAYTTDDFTVYHTTLAKEDLDTVLMLEADRFQHLQYSQEGFRTEAMAVLGEYNKNSASPVQKMIEKLRDEVFQKHTYKHTTMGFLRDIVAMPKQYDYSRQFFERWYKPEYTTVLVVGDVTRAQVLALVKKHFGGWARGSHAVEIPVEPPQTKPIGVHVPWPSPTQPWLLLAFRGPAFAADSKDTAALDLIAALAFSSSSPIYQKLFVEEQKVVALFPSFSSQRDPYLLLLGARAKDVKDLAYIRDQMLATCEGLKTELVTAERLQRVQDNLRYGFATGLDSSPAIAESLAPYIGLTRSPDAINQLFASYAKVTPEVLRDVARRWFTANSMTTLTLAHGEAPVLPPPATTPAAARTDAEAPAPSVVPTIELRNSSPLVSLRLVYTVGAAVDPKGKEGLANVTAQMLARASTKQRSYSQILDALFPMAASVGVQVDKEMTVFSGTVHRDKLQDYWSLLKEMLTDPAFAQADSELARGKVIAPDPDRPDAIMKAQADLERIKSNTISFLDVELRRSNDEELGKEVMYGEIYAGTPYAHHNAGTIESVKSITLEDVRWFFDFHYSWNSLRVAVAGDYPAGFPAIVGSGLMRIAGQLSGLRIQPELRDDKLAVDVPHNRLTIVKKQTMGTGIHIGFPIDVTRAHPDWAALWLVRSWFGEHRSENSHLYQKLREARGLNYGDYAYIEYFPRGMFQFQPDPNLARRSQIFQIWVRPVVPENGLFALRAAWYELDKLVREGLSEADFEATRAYLSKSVNLQVKTDDRRLGYVLDSRFYGIGEFTAFVKEGLAKLTHADVNRAIKEHLRAERLQLVVVTEDAEGFRDRLLANEPSPITYQAKPAAAILAEDAVIEKLRIPLEPQAVKIVPIEDVFRR